MSSLPTKDEALLIRRPYVGESAPASNIASGLLGALEWREPTPSGNRARAPFRVSRGTSSVSGIALRVPSAASHSKRLVPGSRGAAAFVGSDATWVHEIVLSVERVPRRLGDTTHDVSREPLGLQEDTNRPVFDWASLAYPKWPISARVVWGGRGAKRIRRAPPGERFSWAVRRRSFELRRGPSRAGLKPCLSPAKSAHAPSLGRTRAPARVRTRGTAHLVLGYWHSSLASPGADSARCKARLLFCENVFAAGPLFDAVESRTHPCCPSRNALLPSPRMACTEAAGSRASDRVSRFTTGFAAESHKGPLCPFARPRRPVTFPVPSERRPHLQGVSPCSYRMHTGRPGTPSAACCQESSA